MSRSQERRPRGRQTAALWRDSSWLWAVSGWLTRTDGNASWLVKALMGGYI